MTKTSTRASYDEFLSRLQDKSARDLGGKILDAAEDLIRAAGAVSFSTRDLAERAGVSYATPFNYFGSKSGVLVGILLRSFSKVERDLADLPSDVDSVRFLLDSYDAAVSFYLNRKAVFYPLLGELIGSSSLGFLFAEATEIVHRTLSNAVSKGDLRTGTDLALLADQFENMWAGNLVAWVSGALSDDEWRWSVRLSVALVLSATVSSKHRAQLDDELQTINGALLRAKHAAASLPAAKTPKGP